MIVLGFTLVYSSFVIVSICFIFKAYQYKLHELNEFVINSMAADIKTLNFNHPIRFYENSIPSQTYISNIYGKLGIIDYKDYIYNISRNTQRLRELYEFNPVIESKVYTAVITDVVHQNVQLFADLSEEVVKRVFRLTIPLFLSALLLSGAIIIEHTNLLQILN